MKSLKSSFLAALVSKHTLEKKKSQVTALSQYVTVDDQKTIKRTLLTDFSGNDTKTAQLQGIPTLTKITNVASSFKIV